MAAVRVWGSVDGEGDDIFTSSDCFCGDISDQATLSTAPRNIDGEIIHHVSSLNTPIYFDVKEFLPLENGTVVATDDKCWGDTVEYTGQSKETCRDVCVENHESSCIVMDGTTCFCCTEACASTREADIEWIATGKCIDKTTSRETYSYVRAGDDCKAAGLYGHANQYMHRYDTGCINCNGCALYCEERGVRE